MRWMGLRWLGGVMGVKWKWIGKIESQVVKRRGVL